MKFLKNQSSVFMIAGIMAVVVTAFSALILLLAGCGSTDPEPTVATPPPTNESAIHQEPEPTDVHTTDVHTTFSEADIDTSDWVTLDIETGTISIPPTWEYEYGNWGSLNFNGEGATSDTIFMGIGDITMGMDLVAFAEFVNAADSSQPFVFNDGFVGFILEYQTHMSWVRSDSYQGLNFTHGGARSHFVNNEDIITAIAKSFVTGGFEESTPAETSEASSTQPTEAIAAEDGSFQAAQQLIAELNAHNWVVADFEEWSPGELGISIGSVFSITSTEIVESPWAQWEDGDGYLVLVRFNTPSGENSLFASRGDLDHISLWTDGPEWISLQRATR